jgi:hypothetical protein
MRTKNLHIFLRLVLSIATLCAGAQASAATRAAAANSRVIVPITITKTADLNFGSIVPSAAAGTVVINRVTGVATKTGGVTLIGALHNAASFQVTGQPSQAYVITVGAAPTLTSVSGPQTMRVTALRLNGARNRAMAVSGTATLTVGGTLAVAANQAFGQYVGSFTVTVAYP